MPEIINCPQCDCKLRVPDDLLGLAVKCPTCGITFTAPAPATGPAIPLAVDEAPAPQGMYQEQRLSRTPAIDVPVESQARQYQESPPPRRQRADLKPHRGTLILVLGVLSIVFCGFFGPLAWIMGSNDLKEIRAGRMDPDGEGTTNGGRICGIVGTFLNLVLPVCCGIPAAFFWLYSWRMSVPQGF